MQVATKELIDGKNPSILVYHYIAHDEAPIFKENPILMRVSEFREKMKDPQLRFEVKVLEKDTRKFRPSRRVKVLRRDLRGEAKFGPGADDVVAEFVVGMCQKYRFKKLSDGKDVAYIVTFTPDDTVVPPK